MLVLGFTTERYIAVCHPFVKEKYCTVTRAKIVICGMAAVSISIGLVQLYIWRWDDVMGCMLRNTTTDFYTAWTWVTEMLIFGVIPIGCLIINCRVIFEIKKIAKQSAALQNKAEASNAAATRTLLAVSFYFISTMLPATIVYAIQTSVPQGDPYLAPLDNWASDPVWKGYFSYLTVRKTVEELCLSNYAVYFIIYFATGVYFRRRFREIVGLGKMWDKRAGKRTPKSRTAYSMLMRSSCKTLNKTITTALTSDPR